MMTSPPCGAPDPLQDKWMIRSVPLWDPLPGLPCWRRLASGLKIRRRAKDLGRMKSKANTGHLLKCHMVYFICMLETPGPRETAKCHLDLMGEYGSLGRQRHEWAIKCKHHHLFLENQAFDAYRWKHKNGFRAGVSCSWTFSLHFPRVLRFESVSSISSWRTFQMQLWNKKNQRGITVFLCICLSFFSQTGRPRNDLPSALQNSVVVVIITSTKIRANTAKYHR